MHVTKRARIDCLGSDVSRLPGVLRVDHEVEAEKVLLSPCGPVGGHAREVGIGAVEFGGPARRRIRGKTAATQVISQRQGVNPLPGGERQGVFLASRSQVKTIKCPSSRSSCAALDPSTPRDGRAWASSSARGGCGAAADGEHAP